MKTNLKLIRLVLASSLGSVLWAGCASQQVAMTGFDPSMVASAPVDHIQRRADTHPEWRSSVWQTTSADATFPRVLETTVMRRYDELGADSTHLLVFNQEVLNAAATAPEATVVVTTTPDMVITEAAGAERPSGGLSSAQERWSGGSIITTFEPAAP